MNLIAATDIPVLCSLQSKIVRQEAENIESAHEKKLKQAQTANKMYVVADSQRSNSLSD